MVGTERFQMTGEDNLIAELEAEIEHLRDAAERCRKIDLVTRAAIGLGIACLASALLWFKPVALVLGLALLLGGLALSGSSLLLLLLGLLAAALSVGFQGLDA